jgi:hypothetical protein
VRRKNRSSGDGRGDFTVDETGEDAPTQSAPAVTALGPIGSLLVAQEVDHRDAGRQQSFKRGHNLLDFLSEIRLGLLSGGIPRETLRRLSHELDKHRSATEDPRLTGLIDEIDLRARVELAKYEGA